MWAASSAFEVGGRVHLLLAAGYLPLLPVIADVLPRKITPTPLVAYVLLALACVWALSVHLGVVFTVHARKTAGRAASAVTIEGATPAEVLTFTSTEKYHQAVTELERRGNDFRYVQNRIAPYFLPAAAVEHVARLRFGDGDAQRGHYIESQRNRRTAFFELIGRGATVREIYPRERILRYAQTGTHTGELWPLTPQLMEQLLLEWKDAIQRFDNYHIAIADESIPMKYHVIDENVIVLHEPIGRGDSHRLNSMFAIDAAVGKRFADDFDLVWSLIDPCWRDPDQLGRWIDEELIPLARKRLRQKKRARPV
ncbi:MAG TPA: hypothetical protein VGL93_21975 [Streptosporangiaceae bacterium]|jgi:hypothetical protein